MAVHRFQPDFLSGNLIALRKRIYRFVQRENLVQRRSTHVAQNARHCTATIADFVSAVNGHISMMQLPPELVVNIDETDVPFDLPMSTTLERRGVRTVPITSTGSPNRATAILGVSLAGEKLPVFLIFKAKRNARVYREVTGNATARGYPPNVIMTVQENAWCDISVMKEWVERVWTPWVVSRNAQYSYLLMDVFSAHMNASVVNCFEQLGTQVG
jgi:hypothetical protein